MTLACPTESELARLLDDQLNQWEEDAIAQHVVRCSECQHRLEELTRVQLVLPSEEGMRAPMCALERLANMPPGQLRRLVQRHATEGESEQGRSAEIGDHNFQLAASRPPAAHATARQTAESPVAVPSSFGRYEVRRPLGAGSFCSVYLAHDRQLDRPVAVKVLRGAASAARDRKSQLQEARRLARLRHPAIVTVHDVGIYQKQLYIVSDFLDGPSLGEWLKQNRPNWQDAARIAAIVADALAHAHSRLTIHRDVKPANILITAGRMPVLVDFGLALDQARPRGREMGIVSGTPKYMSPEQAAGAAHRIDGRTDIYSLGVVLYEMLWGHVPFSSNDLAELFRQIQDDEPSPPRQHVFSLPPELERVCLKALAKRPEDRYSTAVDMASDLRRIIQAAEPRTPTFACPSPAYAVAGEQRLTLSMPSRYRDRDTERRHVTVLVCGCALFDSEEYRAQLDTKDQARMLWAFRQSCEHIARQFEGTIVQSNQQGVLMCFGYPVAHEDSARRAVLSGLAILNELKELRSHLSCDHRLELGPWVGIHSGLAFVKMDKSSISVVGEAPEVALRLKHVAERGRVICTEVTHQLVRRYFESSFRGRRKVRGVNRPLALFTVGSPSADAHDARADKLTPLVGRNQEMNLLFERWARAREGMCQVVVLVGEPGLGKSRLADTLKRHVQSQLNQADATVIEWHCSPYYQNTPLYPASEFLARYLDFGNQAAPANPIDRLVGYLSDYELARPEVVPLFASLLSLSADARFPTLDLSPVREREATFRALQELLWAHGARLPALFIVEDLHWADPSTVEFLKQLITEGLSGRVLTVLTFRPEFQAPWPTVSHQTSLALNRLTRGQVGEMMQRKLRCEALPAALIDRVHERSGGVPLFVEEFTGVVQDLQLLERREEDGARALLDHEIPTSLQDLVMARVDRFVGDREVPQLAATLGREFSYNVLAAVTTLDEAMLQAELAKMVNGEILHVKGRRSDLRYVFRHAILQECVYKTLIKEKRQQFNLRIAGVLETQFPQTAQMQPELLAHHCTEAGLTEKAIDYWLQAGLRSSDRFANVEAIGHLTKGMELLATLAESPERDAQELQFLNALGTAYQSAKGYGAPEAGPVFRRARVLCDRIGQPAQRFVAMWGAWAWHSTIGDLRLCMQQAAEALNYAECIDDPGMKMEALFLSGLTMFYRADFAGALDHCRRAVADYDDRGRTKKWAKYLGQDSGVTHRLYIALALWHLGFPDQALNASREALTLARTVGHPCTLGVAGHHTAWLYQACRLSIETVAATEEESAISAEQEFALWRATAMLDKGGGIVLQGRPEEALPLLVKGLHDYRATGAECSVPYYLSMLGDAYAQIGRFHDARKALDEGLAIAAKNDDRVQEAELYRLKGELLLVESDNQAAAEDCFRQAIDTARRQQSRAWELRATVSLGRLLQRQGRRDEAHTALAVVYGTFTEGFTTPDLMDAAALLQEMAPGDLRRADLACGAAHCSPS